MSDCARQLQAWIASMVNCGRRPMSASTAISSPGVGSASLTRRWPALVAMSFGLVLLYFVGFSPIVRAHNSAHDTRHANGFPCH
jgi:cobalt transporter subunit CbtB